MFSDAYVLNTTIKKLMRVRNTEFRMVAASRQKERIKKIYKNLILKLVCWVYDLFHSVYQYHAFKIAKIHYNTLGKVLNMCLTDLQIS